MKTKTPPPQEDPEARARREVEEARVEADRTTALQGLLDRRTRNVTRIFGKGPAATGSGSGSSGVISRPRAGGFGVAGGVDGSGGAGIAGGLISARDARVIARQPFERQIYQY